MRIRAKRSATAFSLIPGEEYTVLGLDEENFRVFDCQGDPVLFPRSEFEILEDGVPEDWIWDRYGEAEFYADPPGLNIPGFYEDYFDHKEEAVRMFAEYVERAGLVQERTDKRRHMGGEEKKRRGIEPGHS